MRTPRRVTGGGRWAGHPILGGVSFLLRNRSRIAFVDESVSDSAPAPATPPALASRDRSPASLRSLPPPAVAASDWLLSAVFAALFEPDLRFFHHGSSKIASIDCICRRSSPFSSRIRDWCLFRCFVGADREFLWGAFGILRVLGWWWLLRVLKWRGLVGVTESGVLVFVSRIFTG